jgi:cytochrome c553
MTQPHCVALLVSHATPPARVRAREQYRPTTSGRFPELQCLYAGGPKSEPGTDVAIEVTSHQPRTRPRVGGIGDEGSRKIMHAATSCFALLLSGIVALVVFAVHAQPAPHQTGFSRGQLIASGGGPGGRAAACFTCHGIDGSGQAGSGFPRLAGLDARYLAKQLADYASGVRQSEVMAPIARALSPADRRAVALYYQQLSFRAGVDVPMTIDADLQQHGAALYARGAPERHLQGCINCHGPAGRGLPPTYPALAGQPEQYVRDRLRHFRNGARDGGPADVMGHIARRMNERDIAGAAAYLASLPRHGGRGR